MGAVFALASGRPADGSMVQVGAVTAGMWVTFVAAMVLVIAALAISIGSRARNG